MVLVLTQVKEVEKLSINRDKRAGKIENSGNFWKFVNIFITALGKTTDEMKNKILILIYIGVFDFLKTENRD